METKTYAAQYSTTEGEMWVTLGYDYASAGKAAYALRRYSKAGHYTRIVEIDGVIQTGEAISDMVKMGQARYI